MSPAFENLQTLLKRLPGLGNRSAERICIHLLAEKPEISDALIEAITYARENIKPCKICGNLTEDDVCEICKNPRRDDSKLCIVVSLTDLIAIENASAWDGKYHITYGKLSPLKNIGPENLNLKTLKARFENGDIKEVLFALPNDIESEATCHYIQDTILSDYDVHCSRIGFGLPSGGDITYADAVTLKNALDGKRDF